MEFVLILGSVIILLILGLAFWLDHKIKDTEFKKPHTRFSFWMAVFSLIGIIIMVGTLFMNLYLLEDTKKALIAQSEGIAPISVNLIPKIVDKDYNFYVGQWYVSSQHRVQNVTGIFTNTETVDFYIRNSGQTASGPFNLMLQDSEKRFRTKNGYSPGLEPFGFDYIEVEYWNKDCRSTNDVTQIKEFEDICKENKVPTGTISWILKVDCNSCPTTETCYSFKTCLFNETFTESECKMQNLAERGLIKLENCNQWNNSYY